MTDVQQSALRVLKAAACPTLSGRSNLVYQLGCGPDSDVKLRVVDNTGSGFYSQDWMRFADILREQLGDSKRIHGIQKWHVPVAMVTLAYRD